ncbi:hypothetical protein RHMOL_Rhmol01G0191800 [Rhododendron molle]|uniref:Uncharacterized protein n=1 Tax=Rhododendron molle TaxID=49168 RepID=A0ACC0Q3E5_RHOML|nr:hypothetical protein RHMOL_Rhmol01G0191800 [Rhododendron molle]
MHRRAEFGDSEWRSPVCSDELGELSFRFDFDFTTVGAVDSGEEVQVWLNIVGAAALDRLLRDLPWDDASGRRLTFTAKEFDGK